MVAVTKEGLPLKEKTLAKKQLKEQKRLEQPESWKNKPLHGQFLYQTEEGLGMMLPGIGLEREI